MRFARFCRGLAALAFAGAATVAGSANAGTLDEIAKRGELRVAVQTQGAPFSMVDRNGERTGSSVELAKLMAKEMNVKITFLDYDWDGLIPALLSGKADLLVADMTPTLQRAMKVSFTRPFVHTGAITFTKADSKYKTAADCKAAGTRIAVLFGATGESVAKAAYPDAEIKSFKGGGPLLLDALVNGQADCAVNDKTAITGQLTKYPDGTFTLFPDLMSREPLAFATLYTSPDLREWMNLFLDTVENDGRLKQNLDYWVNTNDWRKDH